MVHGVKAAHWHHTMVDGAKFWISCQWLAFLSKFSQWQLIQNLGASTILWCQCDIQIDSGDAGGARATPEFKVSEKQTER